MTCEFSYTQCSEEFIAIEVNASFAFPHNNEVYEAKVFFAHAIVVRFFVSSFFQCLRSRLFQVK